MPTERQIQEAHKTVVSLFPGARIVRVGPEGVTFEYPDGRGPAESWNDTPFIAATK